MSDRSCRETSASPWRVISTVIPSEVRRFRRRSAISIVTSFSCRPLAPDVPRLFPPWPASMTTRRTPRARDESASGCGLEKEVLPAWLSAAGALWATDPCRLALDCATTRRNPPASARRSRRKTLRGPHTVSIRVLRLSGFGSWPFMVATFSSTASRRRRALSLSELLINAVKRVEVARSDQRSEQQLRNEAFDVRCTKSRDSMCSTDRVSPLRLEFRRTSGVQTPGFCSLLRFSLHIWRSDGGWFTNCTVCAKSRQGPPCD